MATIADHDAPDSAEGVSFGSGAGRWVLAVTVLGSGMAFLDGTVVNVALPDIGRDLNASTSSLQWILNGYLLTLASLILLGGSLGDRYGRRRVFVLGVGLFTFSLLPLARTAIVYFVRPHLVHRPIEIVHGIHLPVRACRHQLGCTNRASLVIARFGVSAQVTGMAKRQLAKRASRSRLAGEGDFW